MWVLVLYMVYSGYIRISDKGPLRRAHGPNKSLSELRPGLEDISYSLTPLPLQARPTFQGIVVPLVCATYLL